MTHPILTRYLYNKDHVRVSLYWAILDKNQDEAFFWAYELFFSGFEEEAFEYIHTAYAIFFEEAHPNLRRILTELYQEYQESEDRTLLGTSLLYILDGKISLSALIRGHVLATQTYEPDVPQKKCTEAMIQPYITVKNIHRAWKVLRSECRFPVRHQLATLCHESLREEELTYGYVPPEKLGKYFDKWLYYASHSPIWRNRIAHFDGTIHHETQEVTFDDEEQEEAFMQRFDYEPDELPYEIQERIVLTKPYTPVPWTEFYEKYGKESILYETVIRRPKKQPTI